jgi:hypothetical protein
MKILIYSKDIFTSLKYLDILSEFIILAFENYVIRVQDKYYLI